MFNLFSEEVRRNPYPLYAQVRANSPVMFDPNLKIWALFDYASVKRALNDHESFSSVLTGRSPDWLLFSDQPMHTKRRNLIMRAFTPRSVASLEPRIRELSRELLDKALAPDRAVATGEIELDLVRDYAGPLPSMVIAEMIGIPLADQERFLYWSEVIQKMSYAITGGPEAMKAIEENLAIKQEMDDYLLELLELRRRDPREDLLTRLVQAEIDGEKLDHEEILGFFRLLLSAGTETSTNVIDNAVLSFIEHPDQLARLRAQPELMSPAIEEIIRYRSPAQMMFREARTDVELQGQTIPAGAFVLPVIGSANRDPQVFDQPERFDIGRDPNPHIAFGHGIHFCIGAALARLEARVALEDLLPRCASFAHAGDGQWQPRTALHVHGPLSLPLRIRIQESVAASV